MKSKFSRLPKKLTAILLSVLVVAGMVASATAGFGPERTTRQWTAAENGFDHVTFNSFTGVPNVGDERDFLRGVQVGRDNQWMDPVTNVAQDAEVEAKIYIHNGADPALNDAAGNPGIAKNVTVKVALPTGTQASHQINSSITADNAKPGTVTDTLDITGADSGRFQLEYVSGSAKLHKDGTSAAMTAAQEQAMLAGGVNIGDVKGCFEYVQEITFRVKVKMPQYKVDKLVRRDGQTSKDWVNSLNNVKRGDVVEWKVEVDNIGKTTLQDIMVQDELPPFMTVVPGSVKLIDANNPTGYVFPDAQAIQNDGKRINVNIGNMNAGINGLVVFKTKVNDDPQIRCGTHELYNKAYATPKGYGSVSDVAFVYIVNDQKCEEPKPAEATYRCEALKVEFVDKAARKVRFVPTAQVSGGATVKQYRVDTGAAAGESDVVTFNGTTSQEYTYPTDKHEFVATLTVEFNVPNQGVKTSPVSDNCRVVVKFDAPKQVEVTPAATTPVELPKTGAGAIAGIFTGASLAGAAVHRAMVRKFKR